MGETEPMHPPFVIPRRDDDLLQCSGTIYYVKELVQDEEEIREAVNVFSDGVRQGDFERIVDHFDQFFALVRCPSASTSNDTVAPFDARLRTELAELLIDSLENLRLSLQMHMCDIGASVAAVSSSANTTATMLAPAEAMIDDDDDCCHTAGDGPQRPPMTANGGGAELRAPTTAVSRRYSNCLLMHVYLLSGLVTHFEQQLIKRTRSAVATATPGGTRGKRKVIRLDSSEDDPIVQFWDIKDKRYKLIKALFNLVSMNAAMGRSGAAAATQTSVTQFLWPRQMEKNFKICVLSMVCKFLENPEACKASGRTNMFNLFTLLHLICIYWNMNKVFNAFAVASWMESEDYNDEDYEANSAVETVAEFLQKFEALSASTADVGTFFMGTVSLGAYSLLKLGFPLGSLVASALNIVTKTESEEYKALRQLHKKMDVNLDRILTTIRVAKKVISMKARLLDYKNNVHVAMYPLRYLVGLFWNPAIIKTPKDVEDFKMVCYHAHDKTPLTILHYIQEHTYEGCLGGLSAAQISHLAAFYPLLNKIRIKISNEIEKEKFDGFSSDFLIWFTEIQDARAMIKKMEDIDVSTTYDSANDAKELLTGFFHEFGVDKPVHEGCLLQEIITGKSFHRKEVEELMNIIRFDVIQLLAFGSICANITFEGNRTRMDWYLDLLSQDAIKILDNLDPYVSSELLKSFPKIEMAVAKSKIDEMQFNEPVQDNATMYQIATQVFETLNGYGNKKFTTEGYVSKNLPNDTNTFTRCSKNCFIIRDYKSLNIMVTKFDVTTDEVKASKAWDWLNVPMPPFQHSVEEMLWVHIDTNYNINSLSVLVDTFERMEHLPLTSEDFYSNIVVLREYGGGTGKCGITSVQFYSNFGVFDSAGTVTYYYAGSFLRQCESYVFLFFV